MTMESEVEEQRWKVRLKITRRKVDEDSMKIGLGREDALCQSKWIVGVNKSAS